MLFTTLLLLAGTPHPAVTVPRDAVRVALDDATIVAIFDAANTFDMQTGGLGARKGTTAEVRDYGSMLVKAHEGARQQGRDLARKLGVTPTPPATNPLQADHDAAMKKLNMLSGKAFDRAFLENEVAYHKAVIAAVTSTLLPAIQNAELKKFVIGVSPVFLAHQQGAEQLLAKLK